MTKDEFLILSREGNPRNSEGSFVTLNDGRVMFVYSRYFGSSWDDDEAADLSVIYSEDDGRTWGEPSALMRKGDYKSIRSVSLLRLVDGRIGLFYAAETTKCNVRCISPVCHYSSDEGETWSPEQNLSPFPYMVLINNDRVVQLKNGRIALPVARGVCISIQEKFPYAPRLAGVIYSDDGGKSWYDSKYPVYPPQNSDTGLQEPGIIELQSGRLMMWTRTDLYCQYQCYSDDGGLSWSEAQPFRGFASTVSPLSIKRDPRDQSLVAIWNDLNPRWGVTPNSEDSWDRTPLVMARSYDDGVTWQGYQLLESDPRRGYCYTAIHFTQRAMLLAYCCGGYGKSCLQDTKIVRIEK